MCAYRPAVADSAPCVGMVMDNICRKCGGQMKPGKAIQQTYTGMPDFLNGAVVTLSAGGPGRLVDCDKCEKCGYSVATEKADE